MLYLFGFLFLFIQATSLEKEGIIITSTDSLKGSIQVKFETGQVIYHQGNVYKVLGAMQVMRVESFESGRKEVYLSESFGENEKRYLFKVLNDGKLPLLYRPGIRIREYDDTEFPPYFMKIGISLYSLSDKRQLIKAMYDHKDEVKEYIRSNGVDMDDPSSLVRIFNYYNSL